VSTGPWGHRAAIVRAHTHLRASGHLRASDHVRSSDHLRASDADREQVLEFLKTAFVQGRLTMDELDARAGQALVSRTYGELAELTADIPSGVARTLPRPPAAPAGVPAAEPVPAAPGTPASAKAAVWAACVIAALPAVWAAFLTYYGGFVILFLLAFIGLTLSTGTQPRDKSTIAG
jgi:Domain of unknown function (DUF1707)